MLLFIGKMGVRWYSWFAVKVAANRVQSGYLYHGGACNTGKYS